MNFDCFHVGMQLRVKNTSQIVIVETFIWDDFPTNDKFCDRFECFWYIGTNRVQHIFNYDEVEVMI